EPAAALLPDPAAGAGLAVARRAHQQDATAGPAAERLDTAQGLPFQGADRIFSEQIALGKGKHPRQAGRLGVAPAAQGDLVELAIIRSTDGSEDEGPVVLLRVVAEQDAEKAHALNLVDAHADVDAVVLMPAARVPVAHENAVDRHDLVALGLEQ